MLPVGPAEARVFVDRLWHVALHGSSGVTPEFGLTCTRCLTSATAGTIPRECRCRERRWQSACQDVSRGDTTVAVITAPRQRELFDPKADPFQGTKIAADHPETVEKMSARYEARWKKVEVALTEQWGKT